MSTLISTKLEFGALLLFNRFGLNVLPSGPIPLVFSILYQFSRLVPRAYSFRVFGVTVSNKVFMYLLAFQVSLPISSSLFLIEIPRKACHKPTAGIACFCNNRHPIRTTVPLRCHRAEGLPSPHDTSALRLALHSSPDWIYEAAETLKPRIPRRWISPPAVCAHPHHGEYGGNHDLGIRLSWHCNKRRHIQHSSHIVECG